MTNKLNALVGRPSSSNLLSNSNYLNLMAERTGVLDVPHQDVQVGSIPASAKDEEF